MAGIADLVAEDEWLDLVGTVIDADAAVELASRIRPDVALLDAHIRCGGSHAAQEIFKVSPGTRLIAFSADDGRSTVREMLCAGALAYLTQSSLPVETLDTIQRASRGQASLSAVALSALVGGEGTGDLPIVE